MSVQTSCPSCQKTYTLQDAMLGKKVACKTCGKPFVVGEVTGRKANEPPPVPNPGNAPAIVARLHDGAENVIEAKGVVFARLAEPEAEPQPPRSGRVARARRRRDRDEDEGSGNNSTVLVLSLLAAGAVLVVLVVGVGTWFFLRASQAGNALAPAVVVDERPNQPVVPVGPLPAQPLMAPANWQAVPDPPAQPVQVAAVPAGKLPLPRGTQILFPTTPSPFAAVGKNFVAKDVRVLVDLRTMQPAGNIPGKLRLMHTAVSPDGLYLAGVDSQQRNLVEVLSFKTGQVAHRLTAASQVDWLDFAASNRLVVVRNIPHKTLEVWDLAKGNPLAARSSPVTIFRMALALSPGRRYLALITPDLPGQPVKILLVDLVQLREAGEILVPLPEQGGPFQCLGLAFSPDGAELAALFVEAAGFRLRTWEMDKGSARVNHSLPDAVRQALVQAGAGAELPVRWWPDRKGWLLYGTALIHYQTGAEAATLPVSPGLGASRCLLPGDLQAAVSGPDAARFLEVTRLPVP